jgi:hypothetical protein
MIGYGRTSTIEQVAGLEAQIRDLKAAGAEKLFRENVSSVAPRHQLEAAIEFAREGDTLVVTKIDRLARSVRHLCEIVDRLQAKGVALRILNMNLDTNDATGKLMLQIIGSIAEFELMTGGDEGIFARRLRTRAFARRITERDADRGFLQAILAGADLAGCPVEAIDPVEIGFRRREKFIARRQSALRGREHRHPCNEQEPLARREDTRNPHHAGPQRRARDRPYIRERHN